MHRSVPRLKPVQRFCEVVAVLLVQHHHLTPRGSERSQRIRLNAVHVAHHNVG